MQRSDSRQEKVGPAAHPHKRCRTRNVKVRRPALYRDALAPRKVANRICPGVETVEAGVVEPRMLNQFELPGDVSIQGNEQHASLRFFAQSFLTIGLPSLAIGPAAPDDPVHL